MKLAKCPHCGAGLDISNIPPGNAVSCSGCGRPFWLAAGTSPPPGPPRPARPPAAPPRPPRRAEVPAARPPGRRRRGFRGGGRNPVPLVLGFTAAVGAAVFGLSWILFAGKGKAPAAPPPRAPDPAVPAAAKAVPSATELERRAADAGLDVPKYVEMQVARAAQSPEAARAVWEELERLGRDDGAARALAEGRKAFPHDPWLNERLGLKDRTREIQEFTADVKLQDRLGEFADFQHVADLAEAIRAKSGAGWLDAAASSKLDGWLGSCRERAKWLEDPVNERTQRLLTNIRNDSEFSKMEFDAVSARPFLLFVQGGPPDGAAQARAAAERIGRALRSSYLRFLSFLRVDAGLKQVRSIEAMDDARLRVVYFRTRRDFDQWHLDTEKEVPSRGVLAYFTPIRQMTFEHGGMDSREGTGIPGLSEETHVCLHECIHQVFDFYLRKFSEEAGMRIPEGYTQMYETWNTPDSLLREIYERAEAKEWGRRGADELKAVMYAHGWAVTHYFLCGEGGKWRAKFLEYFRREIRGDDIRSRIQALDKGYPELEADPALAASVRAKMKAGMHLLQIEAVEPGLPRFLRARDFLSAFGLPLSARDPKVVAWLAEVDAGYRKHCEGLLAGLLRRK